MKTFTWGFIVAVIIATGCTDNDDPVLGDYLFETNYTVVGGYSRYTYVNDRVVQITHHSNDNDVGYVYLIIDYLNNSDAKIKSIIYQPDLYEIQQYDTLVYSGDNLTQIIKTTTDDGVLIRRDTTNFLYDQSDNLIEANNPNRRVEFLEFDGNNFLRIKYYNSSQLKFDIRIKYDNKISPFKGLSYLNLVFFNHHNLEGLSYLTDNNITEITESDFQPIVITNTYNFKYKYDALSRPILITTTRKDDSEFRVEEFYRYE